MTYILVSVHTGQVQRSVAIVILGTGVSLIVQEQQLEYRERQMETNRI